MLKKLILAITALPVFLFAQENDSNTFKPEGGEKTLELQFTPFGDDPININGIRARWFSSANRAFRLNAFVGFSSDTEITQQENSDLNLAELKDKTTSLTINIRPGFEKHLVGTERLSPYFGWELDLAFQTTSFKVEEQNATEINYFKTINQGGYLRLGANAIAGMDYYIGKKLYLGTELGFGFSYTSFLAIKRKSDLPGFTEPDPEKQGGSLDVGPNVVAQIRLGYAF